MYFCWFEYNSSFYDELFHETYFLLNDHLSLLNFKIPWKRYFKKYIVMMFYEGTHAFKDDNTRNVPSSNISISQTVLCFEA